MKLPAIVALAIPFILLMILLARVVITHACIRHLRIMLQPAPTALS